MKKTVCDVLIDIFWILVGLCVFGAGLALFLTMANDCEAAEYSIEEINPETVYVDSKGAEAKGSELIEGIRLMMLECGSYTVPYEDKVEHCAVLFKQLYYTQTVGGYNGWGTTLWGVMHASNTYLQTAPRIWTEDANPTEEIADIFLDTWFNGYSSDFRVQCYRTDWFFEGDWAISAYQIGTTCYSINKWQDFSMFDLSYDWTESKQETKWEPEPEPEPELIFEEDDWFEPEEKKARTGEIIVRLYER